jgi:hypothetical protein
MNISNTKHRCINDLVIITTLPHYIALYFIYNDIYYSSIVILASSSSVLWHSKEDDKYLYTIDHILAGFLTCYEIINISDGNNKNVAIYSNIFVLLIHKLMDLLTFYNFATYELSHSIYHLFSSCKTIYIASFNK